MPINQRGNRFEASVAQQGQRLRKLFPTIKAAQEWEMLARQSLILGKPVPDAPGSSPHSGYTFGQAFDRCLALHWKGKACETKMSYMGELLKKHFGTKRLVSSIDKDAIDEYVLTLIKRGRSDGTVNRHLSAISKILREAMDSGKIAAMPKINKRSEKKGRLRWLTVAEEQTILQTLRHWGKDDVADAMVVSIDTGLRASELMRLTLRDVVREGVYVAEKTKNGDPRLVPLTSRARQILMARSVVNKDRLFPFADHFYRETWDRVVREHLGFSDVVWHTLRHTCCSRLIQGAMPLKHVQEWMGHRAIVTTMRYAHLAPDNLASGASILEALVEKSVARDVARGVSAVAY